MIDLNSYSDDDLEFISASIDSDSYCDQDLDSLCAAIAELETVTAERKARLRKLYKLIRASSAFNACTALKIARELIN